MVFEIIGAFISGIVASFTPCMVALYPLLLFRFSQERNLIRSLLLLILGFSSIFLLASIFLAKIDFEKIRFAFGILLVILGLAAILKILPNISLHIKSTNSFLFGVIMAIVFSTNPCSLPFIMALISGGLALNLNMISLLLSFTLGLLSPIILFSILGNAAITHIIMKYSSKVEYIEKFLNVLLILTGLYLIFSIKFININALYMSSALIVFVIGGIAYFIFPDLRKEPFVIFVLISLILLLIGFIYHCKTYIQNQGLSISQEVCSYEHIGTCKVCTRCSYLFLGATLFAIISLYLRYNRKCQWLKDKIKIKIEW